jgi:hypothetical protein
MPSRITWSLHDQHVFNRNDEFALLTPAALPQRQRSHPPLVPGDGLEAQARSASGRP